MPHAHIYIRTLKHIVLLDKNVTDEDHLLVQQILGKRDLKV
jgi:hypothetical protein